MADEQIAFWRKQCFKRKPHRLWAAEAWRALETGQPYPGGSWERVRAEMIRWLLEEDAAPMQRAA